MLQKFKKDQLDVCIYQTRKLMGSAAAEDIIRAINQILQNKKDCNIIFAAAPSQNEVLSALAETTLVDWTRVNAFHMDEYIGLPPNAKQAFSNFLDKALFKKVAFKCVNYIDSTAQPEEEAQRYAELLRQFPVDIAVMGVGENGHIAFNDPHVAEFTDPLLVKQVTLDHVCRMQQVNDGCFDSLDQVPTTALTLTIPALTQVNQIFCIVPGENKAWAVREMLEGPISEKCPASILRKQASATLYLDRDSARDL